MDFLFFQVFNLIIQFTIGFRGINQFNADFPYNQYKMTQEYATKFLGVAIVDTDLKNMNYEQGQKMMKCIKKNHAKIKWW